MIAQAFRLGSTVEQIHASCKYRSVVPRARSRRSCRWKSKIRRTRPAEGCREPAHAEGHGLLRPAPGEARRASPKTRCARSATSSASARSSSASTPARRNSPRPPPTCIRPMRRRCGSRQRGAALGPQEDHHPRRRAEPHRPGHRVRLLLLPCLLRAARRGL